MARIRTIKPEFYSSPGIESLEFAWRILYIAMWNWADDTGRGTAEARELMGFAFPLDEDMTLGEFRRGLGEVRRVFGVTFYKVSGRAYYAIPAWDKHQKIDKRSGSKWPSPNDGLPYDPVTNSAPIQGVGNNSAETHECPPSIRRDMGAGTGEQGNRGTEDQGNRGTEEQTSVTLSDADAPDFDGEEFEAEEESPTEDEQATDGYPEDFKRFWAIYPRRAGKGAACASFIKAKKRAKVEVIIAGAERLRDDPNLPEGSLIAHPSTWLNQDRWEDDPMPPRSDLSKSDQRLQQGFDLVQRVAARSEETYNYDPFAGKAIEQ